MIKELMHDPIFLAGKSEVATKEDLQVAQDLLDTLMAHREKLCWHGSEYDRRAKAHHCVS